MGRLARKEKTFLNSIYTMLLSKAVTTQEELQQVLDLQKKYLAGANTINKEKEQGFVAVHYSLQKLELMLQL